MRLSHQERQRELRTAQDLERLLQSLEPLPEATGQAALVVMVGLPGTGKSTFSRALAARLSAAVVASDAVRKALFSQPTHSPVEHFIVFQRAHALVEELLRQGISVIFDATNLAERQREPLYRMAEQHRARLALVLLQAPAELVRQRLASRRRAPEGTSDADWTVYERMLPNMERIRRDHYVVDTAQDIGPMVETIARDLYRS